MHCEKLQIVCNVALHDSKLTYLEFSDASIQVMMEKAGAISLLLKFLVNPMTSSKGKEAAAGALGNLSNDNQRNKASAT